MLAFAYFIFALMHVYWAMDGRRGLRSAIPERDDGRPLFHPRRYGTWVIAAAIAGCSVLLLWWVRAFASPLPDSVLRGGVLMLAVAMVLRAIGDFRYFGLFRTIRISRFARMDRWLYTPISMLAGALLLLMGLTG
ncbi:DUF3995 domain-containing protein [Paraburkholderia agricolaris]|uniref:DUF3995 domain-containing protein n=1 Tax=Paraburkholderia agricolaris TaxID=2152888 RepID=A0ABW8ZN49_9BURK